MNNQLTGAVVQPILTVIAKAIIRAESHQDMNIDDIKSYLYKIQGTYKLVSNQESDRFIQAIIETYLFLKKTENLNIETLGIDRSSFHFYKNNDDLFDSNEYNPILDDELLKSFEYYNIA